jgi:hypothetical protein
MSFSLQSRIIAWCVFAMDPTKEQRQWNLLVQGYHWCWELDLRLWSWDKATILLMEKFKLTETEKGETGEVQSQEHAHFLWHQRNSSQWIRPGMPSREFRILLWRFTVTGWKCAKTSPELWWYKTSWLHHDNGPSHASFFIRDFFYRKWHGCRPPPTLRFCFPDWR